LVKSEEKLYRFHSENLRAVNAGLDDVLASARSAIARKHAKSVATHLRLYAFLLGAWAESRLLKLLYEPRAFTEDERRSVLEKKALARWHAVLEAAYRRHYGVPQANLRPPALTVTASSRLQTLQAVLDNDLLSIITLRNKLAHGQWAYPLNDTLDDVAEAQMKLLRQENLLSLKFKSAMLDSLCACIHDIVVSKPAFERDFDDHFRHVEQLRIDIARRSYADWERILIAKYERGRNDLRKRILAGG
jgi:hypothetical protein